MLHIALATLITYLFITFFGRKYSAFIVVIITVAHLSALHLYRMIVDYGGWKLDITTVYMMSVCKFSSVAFSYEDGEKDDAEIKSSYLISK
jgi:lysophospholipid acyltransferase